MYKQNLRIGQVNIWGKKEPSHLTSQKDREKNYVAKGEQKKKRGEKKG